MSKKLSASFLIVILIISGMFNISVSSKSSASAYNRNKVKKNKSKFRSYTRKASNTKTSESSESQSTKVFNTFGVNAIGENEAAVKKYLASNSFLKKKLGLGGIFNKQYCNREETRNPWFKLLPEGKVKTFISKAVVPLANALTGNIQFCFGDYKGSELYSLAHPSFANMQCTKLPLDKSSDFSVVGFAANNVLCDKTGANIAMCAVFDSSGTAAFILNGATVGCAIAVTGIGKIFQPFVKFVGALGFGFSVNKKFKKAVPICYNNSNDIDCKTVAARGHVALVLNLAMPKFKVGSKDLSKIFKLNATLTWMIDFGSAFTKFDDVINSLTNIDGCNKGANVLEAIRGMGAEFTATADGYLTLLAAGLTNGFMPNINLKLADTNLIVTTGGGSTGLNTGFYMRATSDIVGALVDIFKNLWDHYMGIFGGFFKIPFPSIPSLQVDLALFVDSSSMGFQFKFPGVEFMCIFLFSGFKGSCKFNAKFFTAILEAVMWVFRKAVKFFEDTGEVIAEIGANTVDFAKDVGEAVGKHTEQAAKEVARAAVFVANETAKAAEQTAKAAAEAAKDMAGNLNDAANEVGKQSAKYIGAAAGEVAGFASDVGGSFYKAGSAAVDFASNTGSKIVSFGSSAGGAVVSTAKKIFSGWIKNKKLNNHSILKKILKKNTYL